MATSIHVVKKNGNFIKLVAAKEKAISLMRSLASDDLKIDNIANLPIVEKPTGTFAITGVGHYRVTEEKVE